MEDLLKTIMELAYTANLKRKGSVFIYYQGHVNRLDIDIYEGGWKQGTEDFENYYIKLDNNYVYVRMQLKEVIEKLKELIRPLNQN